MNSLEITAYKAFVAHRKAFDTWENGNIDKVWLDDNKNICIKYTKNVSASERPIPMGDI